MSKKFSAAARLRIRTCSGPGSGAGTSSSFIVSGSPHACTRHAFMQSSRFCYAANTPPMSRLQTFRSEFRAMFLLALPIVLAELGWMAMGVVDLMAVGRLPHSAQAIGAVSIGSVVFYTVGVFGLGLLLGLDTLVSQA